TPPGPPITCTPRVFALLAFCLLIFFGIPLHTAYAFSCGSQPAPLDKTFKQSSFVFTGFPERGGGGDVPFRLTHVYKPPAGGLPQAAEVLVSFDFGGGFERAKEYLIFGYNPKVN